MKRPQTFGGSVRLVRMRWNGFVQAVQLELRLDWYRARRAVRRLGIGVHRGDV